MSDELNLNDLNETDWDGIASTVDTTKKSGGIFTKDDERIWKPDYKIPAIYQFYFLPDLKSKHTILGYETHSIKYSEENKERFLFGVCAKTTGQKCGICDFGWAKFNNEQSSKADKDDAKGYLPQKAEYTNILMVKDPQHPENNGKVFIYKLPVVVRQLIEERIKPTEKNLSDDEFVGFIPFQANRTSKFRLDITIDTSRAKSRCDYKKSKFIARKEEELEPIADTKEGMLKILNQCYNLKETIDEYITAKVIEPAKYDETTTIGQMMKGNIPAFVPNHVGKSTTDIKDVVIVEGESKDDLSAEEMKFMDNL